MTFEHQEKTDLKALEESILFVDQKKFQYLHTWNYLESEPTFLLTESPIFMLHLAFIGEALNQLDYRIRGKRIKAADPAYKVRNYICHDYANINPEDLIYTLEEIVPKIRKLLNR